MTIHHLEVRFDVEGEGDEAVFGRLFRRYIDEWSRREREERLRHHRAEQDRALGDRASESPR